VKAVLLAFALCLAIVAVGMACILQLTRWNLRALSSVHPLSWETVGLVWAYALGFTAAIVLLLTAIAVILLLASLPERYASTSTMPRV